MNKVFENVLDLIYPENIYCFCCGDVMDSSRVHGLCDQCIAKLDWLKENPFARRLDGFFFDDVISLVNYDTNAQTIIHNLKLHDMPYIARGIGSLMGELLLSSYQKSLLITCVPMHKEKLKKRGFNQAELLAKYAARASSNQFSGDFLIKIRQTDSMRTERAEGRFTALKGSIIVNPKRLEAIQGREIVVVDDVITTGNTANCCAKELKEAGASKVYILSFAAVNYKGKSSEM